MRIIFIGVVDFSYHCLLEVLKNKGNVVGIVTSKVSKVNSDYRDLTPISEEYNIPVHYCRNINESETFQWISKHKPDIIFCWGVSQIIKAKLLALAPMGIIGVHPALLPENRGRHPLIWALVLGLKESGLTFFFMDEGTDSGPVISQRKFRISDEDTAATLYKKIKDLAAEQIPEFLPMLISRNYRTMPQDNKKANYWRKRSPEDGLIDWRMNKSSILNLIRALAKPYPGAQFKYKGELITVWTARSHPENFPINMEPGKIIDISDGKPVVKCCDGAVIVDKFEPEANFIKEEYVQ